jgi:hypothetical protein
MKKWQWSAIGLIFALLLLAGIGAGHQILAERHEANRFPAPGQLVDIGGRRLHVMCSGAGAPGVLIEASGLGTVLQSAAVQRVLIQAPIQPPPKRWNRISSSYWHGCTCRRRLFSSPVQPAV